MCARGKQTSIWSSYLRTDVLVTYICEQQLVLTDHLAVYEEDIMETRVALIGIIVENPDSVEKLNALLHEYRQYVIGRMGVPYSAKEISVISVAVDAPQDIVSALSGKIGKLDGITAKTIYSKK